MHRFPVIKPKLFFLFLWKIGSSTACVLILNRENSTVYSANIGDSGFIVVRKGQIIHRSEEQQHYFNTPFQLSLPPPGQNVLSDSPDSADTLSFPVENGDVILAATDGVFDNVPTDLLLDILKTVSIKNKSHCLQFTSNIFLATHCVFVCSILFLFLFVIVRG